MSFTADLQFTYICMYEHADEVATNNVTRERKIIVTPKIGTLCHIAKLTPSG
jgi:hypothetical protein